MTFLFLVRRAHLYLGLFLLPWVIMFGVSSIPLNHNRAQTAPPWTRVTEIPFSAALPSAFNAEAANNPESNKALRGVGRAMMNAAGLTGGFYVNRPNSRQINVHHPKFLGSTRVFYYVDENKLVAERQAFAPRVFITGLHTRGGYSLGGFWDSMWALFVDLVSVGLLLWIVSGLIMWWKLPGTGLRRWGWLAFGSGTLCFVVIMWQL